MVVDDQDGTILSHRVLVEGPALALVERIAVDASGRVAVVTVARAQGPNVLVLSVEEPPAFEPVGLTLDGEPNSLAAAGKIALVGSRTGSIAAIDLESRGLVARIDARSAMDPPGRRPEGFAFLDDGALALVSFQKDDARGRSRGNRVALFRLPELELVADLHLPRSMPEHHHPSDMREQGPGPEVIVPSGRSGAIAITCDLYGAVAIVDRAAIEAGRADGIVLLSAAVDEAYGSAFPDRVCRVERGDRELLVVFNAGAPGGGTIVEPASKRVVARFAAPHGLDTPTSFRGGSRVIAASPGKLKVRGASEIEKIGVPRPELAILGLDDPAAPTLELVATPGDCWAIAPGDADAERFVVVFHGTGGDRRISVYDLEERRFVAERAASGAVERIAHRTGSTDR